MVGPSSVGLEDVYLLKKIKTRSNLETLRGLRRQESHKVVLLHSGGVDSTCAGKLLKENGYTIFPIFFDYGQTPLEVEWHCARTLGKLLGFSPITRVQVPFFADLSDSLLLGRASITDEDAFVPGRNTLFMIIAGIYARKIDADGITLGYMLDDNFVFGDNTYMHHSLVEVLLFQSFLRPMKVFTPTLSFSKKELVAMLDRANLLDQTVSCWNSRLVNGSVVECLQCANCLEKHGAEGKAALPQNSVLVSKA